ncbi:MAG: peptide chain release factor N(5)-glutamine methyltransferase [Caulobacterales bacterium]
MSEATLVTAWGRGRDVLKAAGVDQPVMDARLLLEEAAGVKRIDIVTDPYRVVAPDRMQAFEGLLARRGAREPMSQILGRKGFWKIDLAVNRNVLTPRPETELIVEAVLDRFGEADAFTILDLGVGSGAILLAILAARPLATGVGVDLSDAALEVAKANARALGLEGRAAFRAGSWGEGLTGPFDVVVSNPPYIPHADIPTLEPEVALFEPWIALDGGDDGLQAYRALAPDAARLLAEGGFVVVEQGTGQAHDVAAIFANHGLRASRLINDLGGHGRVWTFGREKNETGQ